MQNTALRNPTQNTSPSSDSSHIQTAQLNEEYGFQSIIGQSKKMMEMFALVNKVADCDSTILLNGETGTGKELVADLIHQQSERKKGPYLKFNCAAVPETLLESDLFGYEKGAFTDAHRARKGRFELAEGGTVFLDDIDDMPVETQVKLLRTLQEREIVRLGSERPLKVDFRIITATKRNLQEMMAITASAGQNRM